MGAVVNAIEASLVLGEGRFKFLVDDLEFSFGDKTSSDSRLIGYDDCEKSGLVYFSYRFEAVRIDAYLAELIGIAHILVDGSITVEKNCSLFFHKKF